MKDVVEAITEEERIKRWEEENPIECDIEGCNKGMGGRPYRTKKFGGLNLHKYSAHGIGPKKGPKDMVTIQVWMSPEQKKYITEKYDDVSEWARKLIQKKMEKDSEYLKQKKEKEKDKDSG